jgi:hypothetical protein
MPFAEWVQEMPMHSNRTGGISVTLRLDIYRDGHGCLVSSDKPDLNQPINDHAEMEDALRRLWNRGIREAARRTYFKT